MTHGAEQEAFVRTGTPSVSFRSDFVDRGQRLALAAEARLRYQERRVLAIYDRACHGGRSLLPDVPWRMAEAAVQADLLRGMALSLGAFAKGMGRG